MRALAPELLVAAFEVKGRPRPDGPVLMRVRLAVAFEVQQPGWVAEASVWRAAAVPLAPIRRGFR